MTTVMNSGTATQLPVKDIATTGLDEQRMLQKRQNEQMLIYLFICLAIVLAWMLGTWQFSFVWVFGIALFTLVTWRFKVMTLIEKNIQYYETILHRRRRLRQSETAEWLNFLVNRWWIFAGEGIAKYMKIHLNPHLNQNKPAFVDRVELQSFTLGTETPVTKFIHAYECTDGIGGGKVPMTWSSLTSVPAGLKKANLYQLVLETDFVLSSEDFAMVFRTRLGGKWLGVTADIVVDKLSVRGPLQIIIQLNHDMPFPHIASASLSFQSRPDVNFGLRAVKVMEIMEIPLLKSWIHSVVMSGILEALVDPGKLVIDLKGDSSSLVISAKAPPKTRAEGVLTVVVRGEYVTSSSDQGKKDRKMSKSHPSSLDRAMDCRECLLSMGSQSAAVVTTRGSSAFTACGSFIVNNMKQDKLAIKIKSNFVLAAQTVAKFEVTVQSMSLDASRRKYETSLQKQLEKVYGGETLRLSLSVKYDELPGIDQIMDLGRLQRPTAVSDVSGVVFICIHSASNLFIMDDRSLSNPYCVAYSNGKKVACTHYVEKTKSPKWEVSAEFLIEDISETCLLFTVYNWNGMASREDEFLGAVQVSLSPDEPTVIRRTASLLNSTVGIPQATGESENLGKITVSAVFRPVGTIADTRQSVSSETEEPIERQVSYPNQSAEPHNRKKSIKEKENSVFGKGFAELNIIRAKDLAAMDSNGFSDPFCEVRVNGRKVYTTEVKKKTLSPVWEESTTVELPNSNETLSIMMYDRDVISKNDFLGSVTFTLEDLKKIAGNVQHDGWFPLDKAKSGSLQLRIKVFLEDFVAAAMVENAVKKDLNLAGFVKQSRIANENGMKGDKEAVLRTTPDADVSVLSAASTFSAMSSDAERNSPTVGRTAPAAGEIVGGSQKLPRKSPGSTPVRRIGSESHINGALTDHVEIDGRTVPGMELGMTKSQSASSGVSSSAAGEYHGVRGVLRTIKGIRDSPTPIYVKIRLVHVLTGEKSKKTSSGLVLAKSHSILPAPKLELDLKFEVDHGYGVTRNSLLVFDIKSGHFSHVATKGFTLQELLGDEVKESTKWLPLDGGVDVKIQLQFDGFQEGTVGARRSHSFLGSFRGMKRIKEN